MKIISITLLVIGLLFCCIGSFGMHFAIQHTIQGAMHAETAGIVTLVEGLNTAWLLSIVSMIGCAIIFFGVVLNIISLFTGRKQIN